MKILQFRGKFPNFGDELNTWMWPKLLPDFFDEDADTVFIGTGSTIGDAPATASRKIVCGAGFVPDYHVAPDLTKGDWDIRFVRGPRTAARLGLSAELALSDSALLLRTLKNYERGAQALVSFMPHWESMERGNWERACMEAGIQLIDPRKPVVKVMEMILDSKLVIAEAMHGAIVADAFRIPWVPVVPLNIAHRDKWYDWAESLGLTLKPHRLWPSSVNEFSLKSLAASARGRTEAHVHAADGEAAIEKRSLASLAKQLLVSSSLAERFDRPLNDMAAHRLTQMAKITPMLSSDQVISDITARMQEKVHQLGADYAKHGRLRSVA